MRHSRTILLIAIVLIGWALRIYEVDRVAFRGDEAFTVQNWVLTPLTVTLSSDTIVVDPHPPLSYALFRGWGQIAGHSEFALRVLPALINLLGIAAISTIGRILFSSRVSILLAVMWAVHAFLIWHSQDARNYAIWSGLSIVALAALLRALHRNRRSDWIVYTATALLAGYVYYLEVFILVALNIFVITTYFSDRIRLKRWLASQITTGLMLIPWYLVLLAKLQSGLEYGGTAGGFDPLRLVTWFVPTLLFGDTLTIQPVWSAVITGIILLSIAYLWHKNRRAALLCLLLIIIPMIGLAVASARLNVFTPRYIMASIPAYLLLLAVWLDNKHLKLIPGFLLVGGWVTLNLLSLSNGYFDPNAKKAPDWRAITTILAESVNPDDLVIQTGVDAAFGYYYHQREINAQEVGIPANPQQTPDEIYDLLDSLAPEYSAIWITGKTIPDWQNSGIVERWANEHQQLVQEVFIDGVPIRQYRSFVPAADEYGTLNVTFENMVTLRGVTVPRIADEAKLYLWFYWQPQRLANQSLKIFVHAIPTDNGQIAAQDDHFPLSGLIDSQTWQMDTVFRDVAQLEISDLPAGDYQLLLGWYDPIAQERLQLEDDTDAYFIGTLQIRNEKEAVVIPAS